MHQLTKTLSRDLLILTVFFISILCIPELHTESTVSQTPSQTSGTANHLVLHWPLDELTGDIAFDTTDNRIDGGIFGPQWVPGVDGSALEFNGSHDVVQALHAKALDITQGITIALWIYLDSDPDTTDGNDYRVLMGRWSFPNPYGLILEESRAIGGSVYVDGERQRIRSRKPMPIGQWQHLAFTYDAESGIGKLYMNGTLNSSIEGAQGSIDISREPLQLSRSNLAQNHKAWPGRFDEVYLYRRALDQTEITELAGIDQDR